MARLEASQRGSALQQSYRPGFVSVSPLTMHNARHKQSGAQEKNKGQLLSFPATRAILWDKRPLSESIFLHPSHYREPVLILEEQTLRLANRFAQQCTSETYLCYMIGTLTTDAEGTGLCINVDRFESNEKIAQGQCMDSVVIPCLVRKNSAKPKTSSSDFGECISNVCSRCYSKDNIELQKFVSVKAYCSYHENQQTFIFHVDFTMITCGTKFKVTQVSPVPIVPTALSKNLSGPKSMSHLQGEPKSGYLTMDQTRKLLLVLESDPKVDALPLVGIWISGISEITHPFVWATCLRYLFNPHLKERVVTAPEAFMVLLYSNVRSKPEYYECVTSDGSQKLNFNLASCHEVMQLPKDTLRGSGSPYEMEFSEVESGEKLQAFEAALENNKSVLSPPRPNARQTSFADDIMPRAGPSPQIRKASDIRPSVPEVSLLLDEPEVSVAPRPVPRPMQVTHSNPHPEPNHGRNHSKPKSLNKQSLSAAGPVSVRGQNVASSSYAPMTQSGMPVGHSYIQSHSGAGPLYLNTFAQYQQDALVASTANAQGMSPQYLGLANMPNHPAYGLPAYNQNMPYMYQVPGSQAYGPPHMQGTVGPNMAWPGIPNMTMSGVPFSYAGGSGTAPLRPAYSNQLPVCSNRFVSPATTSSTVQDGGNMHKYVPNVSQPLPHSPPNGSTLAALKSPILRPVRENSALEDSDLRQSEFNGSSTAQQNIISPPRTTQAHSRDGSRHNSPQQAQTASSSTDSGLHFSDNPDPEPGNNTIESLRSSAVASGAEIQPQVLELLRMQDEQLRMLRDQLAQLLSTQQRQQAVNTTEQQSLTGDETTSTRSSETTLQASAQSSGDSRVYHDMATQMSNQATPIKPLPSSQAGPIKRSSAVNTSMFSNYSIEQHRGSQNIAASNGLMDESQLNYTLQDLTMQTGPNNGPGDMQQSVQHSTPVSANSTKQPIASQMATSMPQMSPPPQLLRMSQEGAGSTTETIGSFGDLRHLHIQDRSQSILSDMVVDMPAYTSFSPDKQSGSNFTDTDESNRSPMLGESVSMYERQGNAAEYEYGDFEEGHPINTLLFKDHRQFYHNLMGNVQKLLGNTASTEDTVLHTPERANPIQRRCETEPRPGQEHRQNASHRASHNHQPHPGLNRSLSLPEDMDDLGSSGGQGGGEQQRQRADPMRQSYPLTEETRRGMTSMNDDVAERTRQQLKAMGIELEKLDDQEKSRMLEHTSFFLDPSMLPRLQYNSLVFDSDSGESDLSAHADALAMKYLSDEQLTELAKLRQSGAGAACRSTPSKKWRGLGLERLLQSTGGIVGSRSNNTTMFGSTNMSFASRKYLERYGLLDAANSGSADMSTPAQQANTFSTGRARMEPTDLQRRGLVDADWDTSQGVKVKDFLNALRERSLSDGRNSFGELSQTGMSQENSSNSIQGESSNQSHNGKEHQIGTVAMSTTNPHQQPPNPQQAQFNNAELFRGVRSSQEHRDNRPIFNTSAPQLHAAENEVQVFRDVPNSVPRQQTKPAPGGYRRSRDNDQNSDVENVLDIARLKELPKLL